MVLRSASSFICATISTSDVEASVATQVTRPLASNFGRSDSPSSMSLRSDEVDTDLTLALRRSYQGHETCLFRRIVAEHAGVAAGEGHRAMFGDAADRHAGMLGLDQDGDAAGFKNLVDGGGNLRRQMFLGLQAAGKDIGEPRELRQADDPLNRRIGDVRAAIKRHHVMLALR